MRMKRLFSSLWFGITAGFGEMRIQPLRSVLSIISVGLAVAAVTAILSINGGLKKAVREATESMGGPGRIMLRAQTPATPLELFHFSRSQGLKASDGFRLKSVHSDKLKVANSLGTWTIASCAGNVIHVYFNFVDLEYIENNLKITIIDGRTFDTAEFLRGDPVALIGWTLSSDLSPKMENRGTALVGSSILINGIYYRIVGTFYIEKSMNWRYGRAVLIPWHTAERFHVGSDPHCDGIQLQATTPDSIDALVSQISETMEWIHRGTEDFSFILFNFMKEFSGMINNITLLFSFVAILSLGVGALSILNVMLASLSERVREVGVQKALGARPIDIGIQFLAESVALSFVGGILGMGLGTFPILIGDRIEHALHFRPVLDLNVTIQAFSLTVAIGVGSGLYPAWKAIRLDAIKALQYE